VEEATIFSHAASAYERSDDMVLAYLVELAERVGASASEWVHLSTSAPSAGGNLTAVTG
jgi:hypothetical protein